MADDPIHSTFAAWRDAAEKFDYFLTGGTGAFAGFVAQGLKPVRLGWNPGTLEVLAVLLLVGSMLLGLTRLEHMVTYYRFTAQRVKNTQERDALVQATVQSGLVLDRRTGQAMTDADLAKWRTQTELHERAAAKAIGGVAKKMVRLYRGRNALLVAGTLLLIIARVLPAYMP